MSATPLFEFVLPLTPCNLPLRRCLSRRETASHRILIMRLGAHGDILMGTPTLRALRDAYPKAHITWAVEHTELGAIQANPDVDELLVWNSHGWKWMLRRGLYPVWLARALHFGNALRKRGYDVFISYQPEEWSLLTRAIGAPIRIGVFDTFRRFYGDAATSRNTRYFTHWWANRDLPSHRIDQYLLALDALGIAAPKDKQMTIGYSEQDSKAAADFLQQEAVGDNEEIIVIAPMTTWPTKCWPPERYAALGRGLSELLRCRIVLIGSPKERVRIEPIGAALGDRPVIMAGELSFGGMAALIDRAKLLVSGDTGPMHVASALGVPRVSIFGATAASWYGPLDGEFRVASVAVPCGPCDRKVCGNELEDREICLKRVTVDKVFEFCGELISGAREPVRS